MRFTFRTLEQADAEVGLGLRPDLTGHGLGRGFTRDVVDLVAERWDPAVIVLDVLPWNERAMRAYERAGFVRGPEHDRTFEDGVVVRFVRMRLERYAGDPRSSR
jgi:ribosomal-protein-alanine N-acetyltransferase